MQQLPAREVAICSVTSWSACKRGRAQSSSGPASSLYIHDEGGTIRFKRSWRKWHPTLAEMTTWSNGKVTVEIAPISSLIRGQSRQEWTGSIGLVDGDFEESIELFFLISVAVLHNLRRSLDRLPRSSVI